MQSSTLVLGLMALGSAFANFTNSSSVAVTPAGTAVAPAPTGAVVVIETVTELTTFCPLATTITTNGKTFTATASETITITDCPCTLTRTTLPTPTLPAPAKGNDTTVWTTQTISSTVFVCPTPTVITTVGTTITATAGQTVTVPCVSSFPVTTVAPAPVTVHQNATTFFSTEVVSTLTLTCPSPTTVITGGQTFPVSSSTVLTISEGCPCTVTHPITSVMPANTSPAAVGQPPVSTAAVNSPAGHTPVAPVSTRASAQPSIAIGGASQVGSSIVAWVAAGLFAIIA